MSEKSSRRLLQNRQLIISYLAQTGQTKRKLAETAGLSSVQLHRLIKGESDASLEALEGLAHAMGCEIYDLMLPPELKVVDRQHAEAVERHLTALREVLAPVLVQAADSLHELAAV